MMKRKKMKSQSKSKQQKMNLKRKMLNKKKLSKESTMTTSQLRVPERKKRMMTKRSDIHRFTHFILQKELYLFKIIERTHGNDYSIRGFGVLG